MTPELETEKRRELQLILLREGYTQDEARKRATEWPVDKLDEWIEKMRESAMRFPERQILPPGQIDLYDVKSQREEALGEAEQEKYFAKRDQLAELMAQSFTVYELPLAGVQALLNALEAGGVDRLDAIADIIKTVEGLRNFVEHERAKGGAS